MLSATIIGGVLMAVGALFIVLLCGLCAVALKEQRLIEDGWNLAMFLLAFAGTFCLALGGAIYSILR